MSTDEDVIPYTTVGLIIGDDNAALTAMVYGSRVHIEFSTHHSSATEDALLRQRFLHLKDRVDSDPGAMEDLEDWLFHPCIPHIQHLAKKGRKPGQISLQEYYYCDTLHYVLQTSGGNLEAEEVHDGASIAQCLTPRISMSHTAVFAALDVGIPILSAADLQVIRSQETSEWDYDAAPDTVRLKDRGSVFHFKVAYETDSFSRELEMLLRLRASPHGAKLSVSRLAGLVQWKDEYSVAGILLEHIPDAQPLDWACEGASQKDRRTWMRQIRECVSAMHELDLVWGDAKPANVLIDSSNQAWVVDFGGGYSPDWVDPSLEGTKSGDLQALAKLDQYLQLEN